MKALTIWEPWATLIAKSIKKVETRSWTTKYRGDLAIHAAKRNPADLEIVRQYDLGRSMRRGEIVCVAMLYDVWPVEMIRRRLDEREIELGDYSDGRYAFMLKNIRPVVPTRARGQQGFWHWKPRAIKYSTDLELASNFFSEVLEVGK